MKLGELLDFAMNPMKCHERLNLRDIHAQIRRIGPRSHPTLGDTRRGARVMPTDTYVASL